MQAYAILFADFSAFSVRLAVSEVLVVLVTADFPIIGLEGLLAAREVLLGDEGLLVGSDLGEVAFTLLNHRRYGRETQTCCCLIRRDRRGTFVTVCIEGVDALTVGVLGRCTAVRHHHVVAVVVTVHFLRSFHCALDILDSCGAYFCFCHSRSAFADQPSAISHQLSASTPWEVLRVRFNTMSGSYPDKMDAFF